MQYVHPSTLGESTIRRGFSDLAVPYQKKGVSAVIVDMALPSEVRECLDAYFHTANDWVVPAYACAFVHPLQVWGRVLTLCPFRNCHSTDETHLLLVIGLNLKY